MMTNRRIFLILLFAVGSLSSCRVAKERPILEVPDGNKDRMTKALFSGTKKEPKYWLSAVTVVNTNFSPDLGFAFKGFKSQTKAGYFEFSRDKLKFYNVISEKFLLEKERSVQGESDLINSWSVKHSERRLVEVDGYTTNQEEEDRYISWDKKRFFTVDWSKADISEANTFPYNDYIARMHCWSKKNSYLIDKSREITDDYISFTVGVDYEKKPECANLKRWSEGNLTASVHYKYSFKRISDPRFPDAEYTPYVYDGEEDPLNKKYGFFQTVRPAISKIDGRNKNIFYMNRWNPNKKHTFYFSKDYPEKYKYIAHGVICNTNKMFAKHGLSDYPLDGACKEDGSQLPKKNETCSKGICFELKDNTGQEIGDLRYSFFHVTEANLLSALGYGPIYRNPGTGEIISGHVTASTYYLDYYLRVLKTRYEKDEEKYYSSSLLVDIKKILEKEDGAGSPEAWTKTSSLIDKHSDIRSDFDFLVSQMTFAMPNSSGFTYAKTKPFKFDSLDSELLKVKIPQSAHHRLEDIKDAVLKINKQQEELRKRSNDNVIYPLTPVLSQVPSLLEEGFSPEEIKEKILFNLLSHEFGHVLNLRHNFYGSADSQHWHEDVSSSSVMDYTHFKDEARGPSRAFFGPYDEAALVYAYSSGKKDLSKIKNKHYLFCTDEHVPLNFLCNRFDRGDTPSKIVKSLIENYEEAYWTRNFRFDRAYWNTSNYVYSIINEFFNMKQPLFMWLTSYSQSNLIRELNFSTKTYTKEEKARIANAIEADVKQAIKLSFAFYNAVLQIPSSDRNWMDSYNRVSGNLERVGIFWDKVIALLLLMDDSETSYNPNTYTPNSSYLTYKEQLGFSQMIEDSLENILTRRPDMENWFAAFARLLYADNVGNYYNIAEPHLLEKIAVRCYTPKGLKENFGIDPHNFQPLKTGYPRPAGTLDSFVFSMEDYISEIKDPYYQGTNEKLGVVFYNGNYYTASSHLNKYAFSIINQMGVSPSVNRDKRDIYELFQIYNLYAKGFMPTSCDNGD